MPLMLIRFKSFKTQHLITTMYEKKLQLGSFHDAYFFFSFSFLFSFTLTVSRVFISPVYFFVVLSFLMPLARTLTSGCCKTK